MLDDFGLFAIVTLLRGWKEANQGEGPESSQNFFTFYSLLLLHASYSSSTMMNRERSEKGGASDTKGDTEGANKVEIDEYTQSLIDSYNKEGAFLDPIEIVLDSGTTVAFSKSILARASPVFNVTLSQGADDPIPISKTSPRALVHFLKFLDPTTCRRIVLTADIIDDVYPLFHKYHVQEMLDLCVEHVEKEVANVTRVEANRKTTAT